MVLNVFLLSLCSLYCSFYWSPVQAQGPIPGALVDKMLHYHEWQNSDRFKKLEIVNLKKPLTRVQWWYFDFFFDDGSSAVIAFIPQKWWDKNKSNEANYSHLYISYRSPSGTVERFHKTFEKRDISRDESSLRIGSELSIEIPGKTEPRMYRVRFELPAVQGDLLLHANKPAFAAFPTGSMPGLLRSLINGAKLGSPKFNYVSQVPSGTVNGFLNLGGQSREVRGHSYHEQGRLNDAPENLGPGWTWFHFIGQGWNVFGNPGGYLYLQKDDQIIRSGFNLAKGHYQLKEPAYLPIITPTIHAGGIVHFQHDDVSMDLHLKSPTSELMIEIPSENPEQIWATVEGAAELTINKKVYAGRMFLETCKTGRKK